MQLSLAAIKGRIHQCNQWMTIGRATAVKTVLGIIVSSALLAAFFTDRQGSYQPFTQACYSISTLKVLSPLFYSLFLCKREIPELMKSPDKWRGRKLRSVSSDQGSAVDITSYEKVDPRKIRVIGTVNFVAMEFCLVATAFLTYAPLRKRLPFTQTMAETLYKNVRVFSYMRTVCGVADMANQIRVTHKVPEKRKIVKQGHYIAKSLLKLGFFAAHAAWLEPSNELVHHGITCLDFLDNKI